MASCCNACASSASASGATSSIGVTRAGHSAPSPPWPPGRSATAWGWERGCLVGAACGWGAMTGLGCSVGTLLSGIMAGAASGWLFGATMFAGLTATLLASRRLSLLP